MSKPLFVIQLVKDDVVLMLGPGDEVDEQPCDSAIFLLLLGGDVCNDNNKVS